MPWAGAKRRLLRPVPRVALRARAATSPASHTRKGHREAACGRAAEARRSAVGRCLQAHLARTQAGAARRTAHPGVTRWCSICTCRSRVAPRTCVAPRHTPGPTNAFARCRPPWATSSLAHRAHARPQLEATVQHAASLLRGRSRRARAPVLALAAAGRSARTPAPSGRDRRRRSQAHGNRRTKGVCVHGLRLPRAGAGAERFKLSCR